MTYIVNLDAYEIHTEIVIQKSIYLYVYLSSIKFYVYILSLVIYHWDCMYIAGIYIKSLLYRGDF